MRLQTTTCFKEEKVGILVLHLHKISFQDLKAR
ncbi:hypothetical protein E1A91_A01G200500v1 [Gossypium mustelinum]|uniref:Uncharacterized protein n=1 Tax=Gossypium mustelinum TaxID=34275 RepID=A0A5D3AIY6_GOSMU|nr:hypothetical protein E1A91_A01G200500v1 [Gossypium mustelinum]